MSERVWACVPTSGHNRDDDLTGYRVEATDGSVGRVDKHSDEVGSQYTVVDTGTWIFGREVLLPAGTITAVDHDERRIIVSRTGDEIRAAPEFDEDGHLGDPAYRDRLGGYYGSGH
ncbi:PRC domain containing protein [Streptomyces spongiicola]|uniref:PRC domain containing protein n=1 Tax=Streptomyces spongiicola TaxID=1690221 RepID=A0A388T0G6_9ACTN|nr:PRC-barrel domain containing protein [Streptomyces spongiicola]GBQ02423.1 PRC domain containing protein [Streptomyces spongiicola]